MDNLNIHTPFSFYEVFPPAEARRLTRKLAMPSTPNQGRWLKIAEIELAVLARQCLPRRIGTPEQMRQEIAAWQQECNQAQVTIHWRFTTTDTRIKLKKLYPSLRCDIPLVARKIAREYIYAYAAVVPEKGEMVSAFEKYLDDEYFLRVCLKDSGLRSSEKGADRATRKDPKPDV